MGTFCGLGQTRRKRPLLTRSAWIQAEARRFVAVRENRALPGSIITAPLIFAPLLSYNQPSQLTVVVRILARSATSEESASMNGGTCQKIGTRLQLFTAR
jgi:hypothetical protein